MSGPIRFALIVTMVIALSGCTETRFLEDGRLPRRAHSIPIEKFAHEFQGEDVEIRFQGMRSLEGNVSSISADSLRLETGDSTHISCSFPMRDVDYVQYHMRWFGGLQGFSAGLLGGGLLFGGIGAAMVDPHEEMRGLSIAAMAMGGGILGAIVGTIVGANVGGVQRVEVLHPAFDTSASPHRLPAGGVGIRADSSSMIPVR